MCHVGRQVCAIEDSAFTTKGRPYLVSWHLDAVCFRHVCGGCAGMQVVEERPRAESGEHSDDLARLVSFQHVFVQADGVMDSSTKAFLLRPRFHKRKVKAVERVYAATCGKNQTNKDQNNSCRHETSHLQL